MPLFYFDTNDGEAWTFDDEGRACETLDEMREHALELMPHIARRMRRNGGQRTVRVQVRDATHHVVYRAESLQAPVLDAKHCR